MLYVAATESRRQREGSVSEAGQARKREQHGIIRCELDVCAADRLYLDTLTDSKAAKASSFCASVSVDEPSGGVSCGASLVK